MPQALASAAATLIRSLYNREGDLDLVEVAPVLSAMPQPDVAWSALFDVLLELPVVRERLLTVTDRVLDAERDQVHRVQLPQEVLNRLGLIEPEDGSDPVGTWPAGRLRRKVRRPGSGTGHPSGS